MTLSRSKYLEELLVEYGLLNSNKNKTFEIFVSILSQKRGMPHAHICVSLDPRDKLKLGVNNPLSNDRLDQMIWGEIPVSWNSKYRPPGWRTQDDHRSDRWTENIKLEEDDVKKTIDEDEDEDNVMDIGKGDSHQDEGNEPIDNECPEGIIFEYPEGVESEPGDFDDMQRLTKSQWDYKMRGRKEEAEYMKKREEWLRNTPKTFSVNFL